MIKKLRANNRKLFDHVKDSNYFKSEINKLSYILLFFAISYLLRVAYDSSIGFEMNKSPFYLYILALLTTIPFDLLPVIIVLAFHRRTLNKMYQKVFISAGDSTE